MSSSRICFGSTSCDLPPFRIGVAFAAVFLAGPAAAFAFFLAMVVLYMNERCELRAVRTAIVRGGGRVATARNGAAGVSLVQVVRHEDGSCGHEVAIDGAGPEPLALEDSQQAFLRGVRRVRRVKKLDGAAAAVFRDLEPHVDVAGRSARPVRRERVWLKRGQDDRR